MLAAGVDCLLNQQIVRSSFYKELDASQKHLYHPTLKYNFLVDTHRLGTIFCVVSFVSLIAFSLFFSGVFFLIGYALRETSQDMIDKKYFTPKQGTRPDLIIKYFNKELSDEERMDIFHSNLHLLVPPRFSWDSLHLCGTSVWKAKLPLDITEEGVTVV